MRKSRTIGTEGQIDLLTWLAEIEAEQARVDLVNAERRVRRGYLVFATDPAIHPDTRGYRRIYATEALTPAQAIAKVKPLASRRRLRAFLATGKHRHQLAEATWVD